jgi:hypothetical protein
VLERWAQRFQVSARNAFGLIANVGEDCAGVQMQGISADNSAARTVASFTALSDIFTFAERPMSMFE